MSTTVGVAENEPIIQLKAKDFKGQVEPDWCAGCGDFGVLNSLQKACAELGLRPHEILTVSGIGCSSNLPGYFNAYGMHTLHGRAVAVATGAKLGNHELNVIVTGGDGDGYGIGRPSDRVKTYSCSKLSQNSSSCSSSINMRMLLG